MENLRKLRMERNLSQQKLADIVGISQQAINKYENDISQPDINMLKQLASFFHTSIDYLIDYSDNPNPLPSLEEFKIYEETLTPYQINKLKKAKNKVLSGKVATSSMVRETAPETFTDSYAASAKERYHLTMYRKLNPQMQDHLDLFLEGIAPDTEYKRYGKKQEKETGKKN